MDINVDALMETALSLLLEYAPRVLLALLVLFIGLRVIKVIGKVVQKSMDKSKVEHTLQKFIGSLVAWILKLLLFISVAGMFGIETTSFVAILGAAGLAIGLALQGTLANFAGGVLILIFKPYKVGDLIETQGQFGQVKEIQIFTTVILTPENKTVIVPNGPISNGHITNYSAEGKIEVRMLIGISYDADIRKAKEVLLKVLEADERVMSDPPPSVSVAELGDSAVVLNFRPWCDPAIYWDVWSGTMEAAKYALDENAVSIPFPQMDVHVQNPA